MKKWILSAAFLLAMSSFAAAQTSKTTKASTTTTQKKAVKKGTIQKTTPKKADEKDTETIEILAVHPGKLSAILPAIDTVGIPVRNKN